VSAYERTLKFLYGLQRRGMKFGLRNTKLLLKSVGNPERRFAALHVAGTNGKGSTCAFLASMFTEAGYKTGLYTSPHLVRFTERIRINGQEIPEDRLVDYAAALRPMIEQTKATFFEATTCIAFQYFADEKVDIAVIEVGMGGRLDATNVLRPLVSVITNVAFDHMEFLGNTLEAIAREKGGIIKRGVPCVTASNDPVVLETLSRIARRKATQLIRAQRIVKIRQHSSSVLLQSKRWGTLDVRLGLAGHHQADNAALAVAAIDTLMKRRRNAEQFSALTVQAIRRGLARVQHNTGLRGRFERIGKRYIVDVAHNPHGFETLVRALQLHRIVNPLVILGVMRDKDVAGIINVLKSACGRVIAVQARTSRALSSAALTRLLTEAGIEATNGGTVPQGIAKASQLAGPRTKVLITGSHYVVGEALRCLA
jgi:dihydrofolate synthase/folylpolyglutamate synthase